MGRASDLPARHTRGTQWTRSRGRGPQGTQSTCRANSCTGVHETRISSGPGALIGFAGQRVIANTIKADLPEGFQRAEFLLEHGFVDMIVHRRDLRSEIARLIDYCVP